MFGIIQIPFGLIHKYGIRCIFPYKMYVVCQFYAILTHTYSQTHNVNAIVLLIFETLLLWFIGVGVVRDTLKTDYETGSNHAQFISIVSAFSLPALWLVYFLHIDVLNQPVFWFFKVMEFLYTLPIIGDIINFFTNASTVWTIICFVIALVIGLFVLIQMIIGWTLSKN